MPKTAKKDSVVASKKASEKVVETPSVVEKVAEEMVEKPPQTPVGATIANPSTGVGLGVTPLPQKQNAVPAGSFTAQLTAAKSISKLPASTPPHELTAGKSAQGLPAGNTTMKTAVGSSPAVASLGFASAQPELPQSAPEVAGSKTTVEKPAVSASSAATSAVTSATTSPTAPVGYQNTALGERLNSSAPTNRSFPPITPVRNNNNRQYGNNNNRGRYNNTYNRNPSPDTYDEQAVSSTMIAGTVTGVLDTSKDGHGVLRLELSAEHDRDTYISTALIRRYHLRPGDVVSGPVRIPKDNERYWGLLKVDTINGQPAAEAIKVERPKFKSLTPVYPNEKIRLEIGDEPLSLRIIDLVAPIGKGQRSLIVSPPKAGKTTLLKDIATGVATNHPEIHIMAVLVGERPEEVTDIKRHIARITKNDGEVAASNFDESAEDQCRVAEVALEKAKRMVEMGKDVLILLDSITRLARAYNLAIPTSGRTLSGGFDPAALFPPKKFFGAARNFEIPGSLTIVGTALVETGSRMDDLVYEEFKGTGNQEVHLDRRLAERRIYPAIDVQRSGTRRDDLLMDSMTYQSIMTLQRMLDTLDKEERTAVFVEQLRRAKTNKDFLAGLKTG